MNVSPVFFLEGKEFGCISISGKDAADYLHRQLSNEIRRLAPGESVPVCYLNAQGRIRLYFDLWRPLSGEGFLAVIAGGQRETFIPELERLVFREEIEFSDRTAETASYLLIGRKAADILQEEFAVAPPSAVRTSTEALTEGGVVRILRVDWTCEPIFHLLGRPSTIESLSTNLASKGIPAIGWKDFHTLRIERGTPWPGFEVTEAMIPFECGLEGAVSLTKGCYVGQEVIARMANLGTPPRLLRGLRIEGGAGEVPREGEMVLSGEVQVGEILSSGYSNRHESPVALSSIRKKFVAEGTSLSVAGKPAKVTLFPL